MARNKLAGKSTATSRSGKFYATHKESRDKKKAYDSKAQQESRQVKNRVESTRARRKALKAGTVRKDQDMSHAKGGRLVAEDRSTNRARRGRGRKA